jgi:hypothetical protein
MQETLLLHVCLKKTRPQWFQHCPGHLKDLDLSKFSSDTARGLQSLRSAKFCLGLRGIRTVGWTIPTQDEITGGYDGLNRGSYCQSWLHPEMLHGTSWCAKDQHDKYVWTIKIISFPWRAKMRQGFRLMITSYPLDWSTDWFCFSGCVDANYHTRDGRNIGSFWDFEETIDPEYRYYNVETVMAIKTSNAKIPPGSLIFSMIPIWDPEYQPAEFKGFPNIN